MIVAGACFLAGAATGVGSRGGKPTPAPVAYERNVPILTYHAIADAPLGTAYPELFISPRDFRAQIGWLRDGGYNAVTLDQLHRAWHGSSSMPEKPVVISFDDGLQSQYTEALPVLREIGWAGVLNLKLNSLRQGELDDAMVQRMIDAGWEIDSHTITHADVAKLDGAELEREVSGSRRMLRERFGVPVDFFCYPAGSYDRAAVDAVRRAGYLGATTTKAGLASPRDPYRMRRVRVNASDGLDGFVEELGAVSEKSAT